MHKKIKLKNFNKSLLHSHKLINVEGTFGIYL